MGGRGFFLFFFFFVAVVLFFLKKLLPFRRQARLREAYHFLLKWYSFELARASYEYPQNMLLRRNGKIIILWVKNILKKISSIASKIGATLK